MPNFTEKAFLRVDLNDMINALPKQLTKRRILNPNTQRVTRTNQFKYVRVIAKSN